MRDKAQANLYIKEADRGPTRARLRTLAIASHLGKVEKARLLSLARLLEPKERDDALLFAAWRSRTGTTELVLEYLKRPGYSPYLANVLERLAADDHKLALIMAKTVQPTAENALQLTMTFARLAKIAGSDNLQFFQLARHCAELANDRCMALNLLLAQFNERQFEPHPLESEIAATKNELLTLLDTVEDHGISLSISAQQAEDPLFAERTLKILAQLEEKEAQGLLSESRLCLYLSNAIQQSADSVKQDLARAMMPRLRTIGDAYLKSELAYKAGLATVSHQALSLYLKAIEYSRDINEAAPTSFLSAIFMPRQVSAEARRLNLQIKILAAVNEISPGTARELLPEMLFQVGYIDSPSEKIDYLLRFAALFGDARATMAVLEIALKETLLFEPEDRLTGQAKVTAALADFDLELAGRLAKQIAHESLSLEAGLPLLSAVVIALLKTNQAIDGQREKLLQLLKSANSHDLESLVSAAAEKSAKEAISILGVLDEHARERAFERLASDFSRAKEKPALCLPT